jgi:Flp pilus assembly pilin Flp
VLRERLRKLQESFLSALTSFMTVRTVDPAPPREEGAALVEYALVLGVVVILGVSALLLIGGYVTGYIGNTAKGFGP